MSINSTLDKMMSINSTLDKMMSINAFVASRLFSPGTPLVSTNKADCHDIIEILLKMALK
jgi:hypothetical protein